MYFLHIILTILECKWSAHLISIETPTEMFSLYVYKLRICNVYEFQTQVFNSNVHFSNEIPNKIEQIPNSCREYRQMAIVSYF